EQVRDLVFADAFAAQYVDGLREIVAQLGRSALAVLGEVGEHREKHETADEIERFVLGQSSEAGLDSVVGHTAVAVDGGRPDIFDPPEQSVAAEAPDDVAEDSPKETDIGVLL